LDITAVERAVALALRLDSPVVLAVSGGRDSMVLLEASAAVARSRIAAVATFDHGTGRAARRAAELVARRSRSLGLRIARGRARRALRGEAEWRAARWAFLRSVATAEHAKVATAHTFDDHVETVLIRVLRGAGARGLAGLYAGSDVVRPLLGIDRSTVAAYARAHGVRWVEDPSNRSRAYLRNRVRLDLLPALERARPGLSRELVHLSRRAAQLRSEVKEFLDREIPLRASGHSIEVARTLLSRYDAIELRLLWPAIAARIGLALDRRGTERLALFTIEGRGGSRIQLSGGFEAVMHRGALRLRRARVTTGAGSARPLEDALAFDGWRFYRLRESVASDGARRDGLWTVALPADRALSVRAWRPGDRMTPHGSSEPRRVKGLLRDAGIDAVSRTGWPVVLADDEIVWIPGVRRSSAATVRSGRPVVLVRCDRIDR
jgi:tRNA(Ile)-lysidine synthase